MKRLLNAKVVGKQFPFRKIRWDWFFLGLGFLTKELLNAKMVEKPFLRIKSVVIGFS